MKIALECTEVLPRAQLKPHRLQLNDSKWRWGSLLQANTWSISTVPVFCVLSSCVFIPVGIWFYVLRFRQCMWMLFCDMHWVVLPTMEHMCTYFCTMRADREDISELQIWMWLVPSLCLKPPMLFPRDGTMLPAFLVVKLPVAACLPVLLFGLAGSLESVKCYHWGARCEVNLPCTA